VPTAVVVAACLALLTIPLAVAVRPALPPAAR
jgi:hypothetical protein